MAFSRQDYWSGFPFPSPEDLPDPGIEHAFPALASKFFTTEPLGSSMQVLTARHSLPRNLVTNILLSDLVFCDFSLPWHAHPFAVTAEDNSSYKSCWHLNIGVFQVMLDQHLSWRLRSVRFFSFWFNLYWRVVQMILLSEIWKLKMEATHGCWFIACVDGVWSTVEGFLMNISSVIILKLLFYIFLPLFLCFCICVCVSFSVLSDSVWPRGL